MRASVDQFVALSPCYWSRFTPAGGKLSKRDRLVRMWRQLVLVLLYGWLICVVAAEAQALSAQDLPEVDISTYPWSAIGKLNNSVGGSCTGVVIEQDQVLTAAHCLFNRRTGRFLPPRSLHFLLGYQRGEYKVHALVVGYTIGPGYDPARELSTISSDWTVLKLTEPLPAQIQPLPIVERIPTADVRLMIGSYAQGRPHVMTADNNCHLVDIPPGSTLLVHNCRVAQGSSGAPLLMMEGGVAAIVGIQVAIGSRNGANIMLAISLPSITPNLLDKPRM
jgi:protease YdgD